MPADEEREAPEHLLLVDAAFAGEELAEAVGELEGRDLDVIKPPEAEAVTVEILARWFHERLAGAIRSAGGEALAVRVWESATAFGGYRGPVAASSA